MAQVGDRIGPFELVERVSRGRRTSLFHGVRTDSGRGPREAGIRVAEPSSAETIAALQLEYEALRLVEDERIPRALALYEGHGAVAFEWIRGGSLRQTLDLVEQGRLDLEAGTSMDILVELAYALRNIHALTPPEGRLVHGTLGPDVVHLTAEGRVVLFGLASADPTHNWPLAPEQQRGVTQLATDQWLLGALGLELLRHAPQVLQEAQGEPIEKVFGLLQTRWPAVTRVLARALSEAPEARYEVEERFVKDLLAVARTLGGTSKRAEVGARTLQMAHLADSTEAPAVDTDALLRTRSKSESTKGKRSAKAVTEAATAPRSSAPGRVVATAPVEPPPPVAAVASPMPLPEAPAEVPFVPPTVPPFVAVGETAPDPAPSEPEARPARPRPLIPELRVPSPEEAEPRPTIAGLSIGKEPSRPGVASLSIEPRAPEPPRPSVARPAVRIPEPISLQPAPSLNALLAGAVRAPDADDEATEIDTRGVVGEDEVGDYDWEATGEHARPEVELPGEILPQLPPRLRALEPEPRVELPPEAPPVEVSRREPLQVESPRVLPEPSLLDDPAPVDVELEPDRAPVADPVPDRWVGVAIAVFGLIAIGVLIWAVTR